MTLCHFAFTPASPAGACRRRQDGRRAPQRLARPRPRPQRRPRHRSFAAGRQRRLPRRRRHQGDRRRRRPASPRKVIVVAVKPQIIADVLPGLRPLVGKDTLVLSIAAGTTLKNLKAGLGDVAIVRSIPNTPAQVGRGITVAIANDSVDKAGEGADYDAARGCRRRRLGREGRHDRLGDRGFRLRPGLCLPHGRGACRRRRLRRLRQGIRRAAGARHGRRRRRTAAPVRSAGRTCSARTSPRRRARPPRL